ncbi:12-oxophytodienoate reductase [Croceicoccus ponticola]|uniref:12-oxophytodienoate reductase n=1 Tax=Croceicoccus ponticola TaxID=2217664 RepID=A0A437GZB2_9SPHN|nr:12-oxophytodienoate reductase [Croceicoccus ponticola]RVQ68675.1 12-oxophytodienoate reductase [Croceicoccus ponticola]
MTIDPATLFEPLRIGGMTVPNRIALAPMTREFAPDGVPGDDVVEYYRRRAAGGTGLIITEGMAVNATGAHDGPIPLLFQPETQLALARIATAVTGEGACIVPQLWHVGLQDSPTTVNPDTVKQRPPRVGPSGIYGNGKPGGSPMTDAQIADTIADFARCAAGAMSAGCDGIEIHGAHGYLPDQFMWSRTNRRKDRYGGDVAQRSRFLAEIVAACRAATSPDFAIIARISQWKSVDYDARLADSADDWAAMLAPLCDAGVDAFHCSTRRFWEPAFPDGGPTLAALTRRLSGRPVIAVGSVTLERDFKQGTSETGGGIAESAARSAHVAQIVEAMEAGEFDMIAVGRAMIANADWANIVREGRADNLRPFAREMLATLA